MLVITLDEYGRFEDIEENNNKMAFIGGFIYSIPDELSEEETMEDYENEKDRLYYYLRAICLETGKSFPHDLHDDHDDENGNSQAVREVKRKVRDTLAEFMQRGECHFEGNPFSEELHGMNASGENSRKRKGEYHIFAYLKYRSSNLLGNSASVLVREDYASNLYIQMATEIVERIIFHNPVLENVQEVWLDIPTRTYAIQRWDDPGRETEASYRTVGHTVRPERGIIHFPITNGDVYRTALSHEMLNTDKTEIILKNLTVKSTNYNNNNTFNSENESDIRNEYRDEVFRYMADLVCSSLSYSAKKSSQKSLINDFKSKAEQYTGHEDNLIFAYDIVDLIFKKAWHAMEEKDYFEALDLSYKGENSGSPYAEYYKKIWFDRLKKRLLEENNAPALGIAVRKFYGLTRTNNLTQDELIEMLETLEPMTGNVTFQNAGEEEPFNEAMYDLYDGAAAAYNHKGDSEKTIHYLELCKNYAEYTSPDRYLRTQAKRVVCLQDMFQYDDAVKLAEEHYDLQGELQALWGEILDRDKIDDEAGSLNKGIALSQLGQEYAVTRNEKAEKTFLDAMSHMKPGSPDYEQTTSYLLHYYIVMKEQKKYDDLAREYFKASSLSEQFENIIREGAEGAGANASMKFALYVYVKGLYVFHLDDIDKSGDLLDSLCNIESTIHRVKNADMQINGHPWEIIYKYLALIAHKKGRKDDALKYKDRSMTVLKNTDFLLDAICQFGEWEYAREAGNKQIKISKKMGKLFSEDKSDRRQELYKEIKWDDIDAAYTYLKENVLTYMYS